MATDSRAFRTQPRYAINIKDKKVYHVLDLKKRLGTYCNLSINQEMDLRTHIPANAELCSKCAEIINAD